MPEGYLFDTVTCSRWRQGDAVLRRKVETLPPDAILYTSVISVGELTLGLPWQQASLTRHVLLAGRHLRGRQGSRNRPVTRLLRAVPRVLQNV